MHNTVEDIAQHFYNSLGQEDKDAIVTRFGDLTAFERILTESSVKMTIRNEYGLWHDSPLTEKWRTDESSRKIIDGTDYSDDHPDNISATIYDRVVEIAIEAKGR